MTVITAGDPVTGVWCPVCLEPSRLRLELFADGQPAGGLEICPGCGTGHDKPGAYLTPAEADPDQPDPGRPAMRIMRIRWPAMRIPGAPDMCAAPHCARRPRHVIYELGTDDGVVTYWFCRKAHRAAWCAANALPRP